MNLFQAAALGATEKGATSVANKIRREAEEAFKKRMLDDEQAFTDEQNQARMIHDANQTVAQIGARQQEGLLDRQHQSEENKLNREADLALAQKRIDADVAAAEAALKKAEAKAQATQSKENRAEFNKASKAMLDNYYKQMEYAIDDSQRSEIQLKINRLENALKSQNGIIEPQQYNKQDILNAFMEDNGITDAAEAEKILAGNPKYASMFAAPTPEPEQTPTPTAKPKERGLLQPDVKQPNPNANTPENALFRARSAEEQAAKAAENKDLERQRQDMAGAMDKSQVPVREASSLIQKAYRKIEQDKGQSISPTELAALQEALDVLLEAGMTETEQKQAQAVYQFIYAAR